MPHTRRLGGSRTSRTLIRLRREIIPGVARIADDSYGPASSCGNALMRCGNSLTCDGVVAGMLRSQASFPQSALPTAPSHRRTGTPRNMRMPADSATLPLAVVARRAGRFPMLRVHEVVERAPDLAGLAAAHVRVDVGRRAARVPEEGLDAAARGGRSAVAVAAWAAPRGGSTPPRRRSPRPTSSPASPPPPSARAGRGARTARCRARGGDTARCRAGRRDPRDR